MRFLLIAIAAGFTLGAACIPVSSNTILARDVAEAVPLFRSLAPETLLGFAPFPGVQRILTARDLLLFARQQGLKPDSATPLPSLCIERATHPIDAVELKEALIQALAVPGVQPVPPGRMEFSLSGLTRPPEDAPATPVIWRGRLWYDSQSSLSIWAKLILTVERPALIASERIPCGATIEASQVATRVMEQFPLSGPALDSMAQATGKIARRTILPGQRIAASALAESTDVARGETVRVQVVDGPALLTFDAVAESSGRKGDQVMLRNPSSGRTFRGLVEDKGKVMVRPPAGDPS
jgi:flagellar basal body P-ring formation protein FlgA